jgi:hypothetical protein
MERTKTTSWDDPQRNKRDAIASISRLEYLKALKVALSIKKAEPFS